LPIRSTDGSVGYDVRSTEDVNLSKDKITMVPTGLALATMPPNTYLRIAPRSGLAAKHGVQVLAGVVDPDYRGEIKVILTSLHTVELPKGSRVAQFIVEGAHTPETNWSMGGQETQRGQGGFGSTGL